MSNYNCMYGTMTMMTTWMTAIFTDGFQMLRYITKYKCHCDNKCTNSRLFMIWNAWEAIVLYICFQMKQSVYEHIVVFRCVFTQMLLKWSFLVLIHWIGFHLATIRKHKRQFFGDKLLCSLFCTPSNLLSIFFSSDFVFFLFVNWNTRVHIFVLQHENACYWSKLNQTMQQKREKSEKHVFVRFVILVFKYQMKTANMTSNCIISTFFCYWFWFPFKTFAFCVSG